LSEFGIDPALGRRWDQMSSQITFQPESFGDFTVLAPGPKETPQTSRGIPGIPRGVPA